jgi:hypothetical protein
MTLHCHWCVDMPKDGTVMPKGYEIPVTEYRCVRLKHTVLLIQITFFSPVHVSCYIVFEYILKDFVIYCTVRNEHITNTKFSTSMHNVVLF